MAIFGLTEKQARKLTVRQKAWRAVKAGLIIRPDTCEVCDKACKPDGHHPDYNEPFTLVWMCRQCHMGFHAWNGDYKLK